MSFKKQAVMSLSGGMDSTSLMIKLLSQEYNVLAISFDYGQKHSIELVKAMSCCEYVGHVHNKEYIGIQHKIFRLDFGSLLYSSLTTEGYEVPEGHYENENMIQTVVPNRNKMFMSILQAVALSLGEKMQTDVIIGLGVHSGDHAIYPDCREEFYEQDMEAFRIGNYISHKVELYLPYLNLDKAGILKDGQNSCDVLGLDFDEVYRRTNTSYKPNAAGMSDYKSASSVERIEAFVRLGKKDPVQYADGDTPVSWTKVVHHVNTILGGENGKTKS